MYSPESYTGASWKFFYNPVWFITPEEVTGKSVRVFVLSWHIVGEDKNV